MRKFEFRPWGWYITLDEGVNYKVKKIHLNPNTKLSLQYHHHRDEHWTVVEGSGKAIVNKNVFIHNTFTRTLHYCPMFITMMMILK